MCTPCVPKPYGNVHLYKEKLSKPPTIEQRYYALREKRAKIMRMIYEFAYENKALKQSADKWCRGYKRKLSRRMPYRSALSPEDIVFPKYRRIANEGVTRIEIPDV